MKTFLRASSIGALLLLLPAAAMAELGGTASTVQADQQRVNGTRSVSQRAAYAKHEIRTGNNGVIHEFVGPDGKVFAVTYQGRFPGESNGLLGAYSAQLEQVQIASPGQNHVGGSVRVETPEMVYHAAGHLGYFSMTAYVKQSVPKGVAMEEIR